MKTLHYTLVDVFTNKPFGGNQLAVFKDDGTLPTELMQKIARELNLSETVFIRPSRNNTADKELRIFTPQIELPIAGHPTVGAAYVLGNEQINSLTQGENKVVFETGVGDITVQIYKDNNGISSVEMTQKTPEFGPVYEDIERVAELLSLSPDDIERNIPVQTVSTGVPFLFIPIRTLAAMEKIKLRTDIWEQSFRVDSNTEHIFTFTSETMNEASTVHSRMFAPAMGIAEDPATGNASGPLGAYLVEHSVVSSSKQTYHIRSEQGIEMGRPSFIDVTVTKRAEQYEQVKISGNCVTIGSGQLVIE
ncbi:PhzF family phenazine biosynthesis protein [Bacillus solimangrovi]|uniref:Phenazine biosynthesis protein PhzF n=1 Tax=Bacillus solimangrovi TaxID=1305675 RepID=A0A1E5LI56_9BACI|nr:PhzF family phenazine biosynthesis protein [Bacillus solimangrovi]OEH93757.1 phenazine biosynthesis protein PhzF [Bacillus solimangrovi]